MVARLKDIITDKEKNNPDYKQRFNGMDFMQVKDLTADNLNHLFFIMEKEGVIDSTNEYNIFQVAKVWDILASRCLDKSLQIF